MNKVGWKLGQKNEVKMEQENLVKTLPTKEALLASLAHLQKLRQKCRQSRPNLLRKKRVIRLVDLGSFHETLSNLIFSVITSILLEC